MDKKPEPQAQQEKKLPPPDAELRDITDDVSSEADFTERQGLFWNQRIRLILAIFVVFISALLLWWIVS